MRLSNRSEVKKDYDVEKKIALFCYSSLEPNQNGLGAALRFWIDIKALGKLGFEVIKVKFIENPDTDQYEYVKLPKYKIPSGKNWLSDQIKKWGYPIVKPGEYFYPQCNRKVINDFSEILRKFQPDLLFFEHVQPWYAGSLLLPKIPTFVCFHDYDHILRYNKKKTSISNRAKSKFRKLMALTREKNIYFWLQKTIERLLRQVNGVITCGHGDCKSLKSAGVNAQFIQTPVTKEPGEKYLDIIKSKLSQKKSLNPYIKIVHVGGLRSSHNEKGIRWFFNECLPFLRNKLDGHEYQIHLIGSYENAAEDILKFKGEPDLHFRGFVNDLEKELADADFAIVPPGYPTGFRTKIPEAFAYGLPVVTGKYDAYGVGLPENDPRVITTDDPQEYAHACIRLIRDADLRCKMGKIALETWRKDYDPDKIIKDTAEWIKANAN